MPESSSPARHRSAARPTTSLTDLTAGATGAIALVGRRSAVALASSGLVLSAFAAPAAAAPLATSPHASSAGLPGVDTTGVTASARALLETSATVSVPADTAWSLDVPALTAVVDPPPEPEPERVVTTAASDDAASDAESASDADAAVPAGAVGSAVIEIASRYVGVPYLWGGGTPGGFDCSGFTSYVYAQLGITLPHSSASQRNVGTVVSEADAQAGDLIVTPGHVALYAGDGMLIDATPGDSIKFHEVYQSNPVYIRVG
ncbi:C40 family peptidase [Pengzhenrongella sicca]|uniref:C40 family peptidase n=1 Tax=Pengzhenrongella sicca TaxID=2819238 RepID=A0A8A4ZE29_9MICO|nr:C40 family peptidase [Pengzhenrongella sicca]QTE29279.1 C40 family peptidase [Pengzhenrongella sicca]